ncbi:MAG: transporter permease [Enterovirga sp.]|nr:transporter permease [Enterovirga sp.]
MPRKLVPLLLVLVPTAFLFVFFAIPNAFLLTASFLKSEAQALTDEVTLENYQVLFRRTLYVNAIIRTFTIGAAVGALVVVIAYPLAFFLSRTTSRWKEVLMALSLSPLLASVVVRTYGWWVVLNREGALNDALRALRIIDQPYQFLPSSGAIVLGLTHSLLPYGIITIMTALNGVNPRLEQAAMSLGASRTRTFLSVTLPLSSAGIAGAFLLAFALAISAYATPQILGGPATPVMATQIYNLMLTILDWSLGSAMSVLLIVSAAGLMLIGTAIGSRRRAEAA